MAIGRRFRAGSKVRVRSGITEKICEKELIPYDFPGARGVFRGLSPSGKAAIDIESSGLWYISERYLEPYCMFDGKEAT